MKEFFTNLFEKEVDKNSNPNPVYVYSFPNWHCFVRNSTESAAYIGKGLTKKASYLNAVKPRKKDKIISFSSPKVLFFSKGMEQTRLPKDLSDLVCSHLDIPV